MQYTHYFLSGKIAVGNQSYKKRGNHGCDGQCSVGGTDFYSGGV